MAINKPQTADRGIDVRPFSWLPYCRMYQSAIEPAAAAGDDDAVNNVDDWLLYKQLVPLDRLGSHVNLTFIFRVFVFFLTRASVVCVTKYFVSYYL